jgi:hypothetical protein
MTLATRAALATLTLSLFAGCAADDRSWLSGDQELYTGTEAITALASAAVPSARTSGLLPSPLLGPDRISVFVGDELALDLELVNPQEHSLIEGILPTGAFFMSDTSGGIVTWTPTLNEVGEHNFVFHAVLTDNPEQVTGTAAIDVSVLPRFGLVEYGF